MTIAQFYATRGDDLTEVLSRLGKEERIKKYLLRFWEDDSWAKFEKEYADRNYEEAFRHIHSIKGMCLNLGLKKMLKSSETLCEALRNGKPSFDVSNLINAVREDYDEVISQINCLSDEDY